MLNDWLDGKSKRDPIPKSIQNQVLVEQGYRCNGCDLKLPPKYFFSFIKSIDDGGNNSINNIVALCPNCHCEMDFELQLEKDKKQFKNNPEQIKPNSIALP